MICRGGGRALDFLEGFTRVAALTDEGGQTHPVGVLWKRNLAALGNTPFTKMDSANNAWQNRVFLQQLSASSSALFLRNDEPDFLTLDLVFEDRRVLSCKRI